MCDFVLFRGWAVDIVAGAWVSLARRPHLINWVSGYQNDRTGVGGGSYGRINQEGRCSGKKGVFKKKGHGET